MRKSEIRIEGFVRFGSAVRDFEGRSTVVCVSLEPTPLALSKVPTRRSGAHNNGLINLAKISLGYHDGIFDIPEKKYILLPCCDFDSMLIINVC